MSSSEIQVIAGLGNPGSEYDKTRHNIGFAVVDALARAEGGIWKMEKRFAAEVCKVQIAGRPVLLAKPQTFMNESGASLGPLLRYHRWPASALVACYDEINLDVAGLKLSLNGSAGGHNGIASLLRHVGNGFVRFRIGIGQRPDKRMDLKDYVLGKFSPEAEKCMDERLPDFIEGLRLLTRVELARAMNQLNTRQKPSPHTSHEPNRNEA